MVSVLFFVPASFCKRDYERYGIDTFIKNGFDVWVWDLTLVFSPFLEGKIIPPDPIEWERHRIFKSKTEVVSALKQCKEKTIIIDSRGYDLDSLEIYRAISKRNIPYVLTPVSGVLPIKMVASKAYHFRRISKIFNPRKLGNYIIQRIPTTLLGVNPATFILAEGQKCDFARPGVTSKTKVIRTHALDYDIYLRLERQNVGALVEGNIAVFLDNYLPHHPDCLFSGTKSPVTSKIYYAELRKFFDAVERMSGLKVVVAAHPRSKYEEIEGELFGSRRIISGKTAELVKQADLILTTFSTSISFGVLYKKPILFMTTDEINLDRSSYDYRNYIYELASLLGRQTVNISREIPKKSDIVHKIDLEKYNDYVNDYIKIGSSEQEFHPQIVSNVIKDYWSIVGHSERKE